MNDHTVPGKLITRFMLITNKLEESPFGGRELLCKLNHDALNEIYGSRLILIELPRSRMQGLENIIYALSGYIDGLSGALIANAIQIIRTQKVNKVFVDGSNLGELVKVLKQKLPRVEIITFFHNVEAKFFLGSLKQVKTLRALAVLIVNYRAERKSVFYSDKLICLSNRDSQLLHKLYGRSATHVSPLALQDKLNRMNLSSISDQSERFALFVGGDFYANRAGISWFVKHVTPLISIKTYIVGRGFDDLKDLLEIDGKVKVIGSVDSLAPWYVNSYFVIAPIFDGSGMKTKVAEALMFGKRIIGTPEAFSGYEEIANLAGSVCTTRDEFVTAIENSNDENLQRFNPKLRALYEEKYSFPLARSRLLEIVSS